MKFAEIRGQSEVKEHLQRAISLGKNSHAYILSGEKDAGKMMLAEAFAATILCEEEGEDACGQCRSCKQASSHNHPDIRYVTHEKPNTISVDDIRVQLNADIVIKPYASKYKIYIVDEAEKMNKAAQNALLKTIEEPPAYAIIFLLTNNISKFLPTILSRCVTLELAPVSDDIIRKELMQHHGATEYKADVCVAFAQGNLGKAIRLASSEEFNEMKAHMVDQLRKLTQMDVTDITQAAKGMVDYKERVGDYLDLVNIWFRDVLLYKATGDVTRMIFYDESLIIRRQAENASYEGLNQILDAIATARRRIVGNGNYELAMELLLLSIKENIE